MSLFKDYLLIRENADESMMFLGLSNEPMMVCVCLMNL